MKRRSVLACLILAAACATQPFSEMDAPVHTEFISERISVVTRGRGADIILIPGMGSHRDVWSDVADAIEGRYRVHLVQVNGFAGFPAGANTEGSVSAPVAEEVARYIDEGEIERPAIVGHSMGGAVAMMVAARHPEAVGRLMVVDMFPFIGVMVGGPGASAESVRPVADQLREQMIAAPESMIEQLMANATRLESVRPRLVQHARDSNPATMANAFHELIVTDLRPELANITAPITVLYVVPPNPPVTPREYEQFLHLSYASAPQARLIRIEDSQHFIMIDRPQAFLTQLDSFMTE